MDFVFSPVTQTDLVIAELPFEDTINKIADEDTPLDIRIAGKSYRVNIGASRLRVFKKNPVCCCCGIRATEATLDLDAQQTKDAGENRYHVNLYARTGDRLTGKTHLVLFTKDHIIARSRGGADNNDNAQTLCFNCNTLKDNTQLDLEHMRLALFPAYRAYQSSKALTLAKERLHNAFFQRLEKAKRGVVNITKALELVKDDRAVGMRKKLEECQQEIDRITTYSNKVEREAQITGTAPDLEEIS